MLDIGGWSSKLVFLGSSSLTNLLFLMVNFSLLSTLNLISCCSCGLIPTTLLMTHVASFSLITSPVVLASKLFPPCVGQGGVPHYLGQVS